MQEIAHKDYVIKQKDKLSCQISQVETPTDSETLQERQPIESQQTGNSILISI